MEISRIRLCFFIVAVGASLAAAPAASAQSCIGAPGRAALEQYCESVPGPGGDRGSRTGGDQPRLSALAMKTRKELENSPGEGRELGRFLASAPPASSPQTSDGVGGEPTEPGATSPRGPAATERPGGSSTGREVTEASVPAKSGVAAAIGSSSSAGAGVLLGVGFLGLLATVAVLIVRRRATR